MRLLQTLLASSLLLAASCGSSDPATLIDEGNAALSKDPAAALESYQEALSQIDATHPRFQEATMKTFRARCTVEPAKVKEEFLAYAGSNEVKARDYRLIAVDLCNAAKTLAAGGDEKDTETATGMVFDAVDIVTAGKEAFKEEEGWDKLVQNVGDTAGKLGIDDPKMSAALSSLGYAGE